MEAGDARTGAQRMELDWRSTAIVLVGAVTVLAGIAWAFAQPYRLAVLDSGGHGLWDYIAEPPLLVIAVGVVFQFTVAHPLLRELRGES